MNRTVKVYLRSYFVLVTLMLGIIIVILVAPLLKRFIFKQKIHLT
jgi:hypothetical protein